MPASAVEIGCVRALKRLGGSLVQGEIAPWRAYAGDMFLRANLQTAPDPTVLESQSKNSVHPGTTGYEMLSRDRPELKAPNRA